MGQSIPSARRNHNRLRPFLQLQARPVNMSDAYFDEYDHYNFDDKLIHSRGSGKNRSKQEAEQNKLDKEATTGHTRKIVNNMRNNEANNRLTQATAIKH